MRRNRIAALLVTAVALLTMLAVSSAQAMIASEITDTIALKNLGELTNMRFAPNGEVFAIDKEGQIFDFPSLAEPTNDITVADLSKKVMDYKDRGLLGLAIDPNYPVKPYIYVLYAYDAPPGETAPVWPNKGSCPTPPGPGPETAEGGDGCVVTGMLSRITVSLSTHKMLEEKPLVHDWCQQFTSHSVDDLQFGPEGALYASGGTGGAYNLADWGQLGGTLPNALNPVTPKNPCGDPNENSTGAGTPGVTEEELETAEGGVLRAQSFRRPSNQPASLDGTVIRVNPENGEPLPSNPNIAASGADRKRIVAYGLRQPFRFLFRPNTEELWIGDVGESKWEELDRDSSPLSATEPSVNFGWPCFEGEFLPYEYGVEYEKANICKRLYPGGSLLEENTAVPPYYAYNHGEDVSTGDECPYHGGTGAQAGSVISGLAFLNKGPWPSSWYGALFYGDISKDCIWAMMPSKPGGLPEPTMIKTVESLTGTEGSRCYKESPEDGCVVDMELGPEGDIYYSNGSAGTEHRLTYEGYPVAVIGVSAAEIEVGKQFTFTGNTSTSPDPGSTTYRWEFGDGESVESANVAHTYAAPGTYTAKLTVTDSVKKTHDTSSVKVTVVEPEKTSEPEKTPEPQGGGSPPAGGSPPVSSLPGPGKEALPALTLSGVSLKPTSFQAARTQSLRKSSGSGRSAMGATLRFSVSQKATIKLTFAKRVGKSSHYQSVTAHGAVKVCTGSSHKRKCRTPSSSQIVASAGPGAGTIVLSGWVGGVALPAGSYRFTVQAVGAGSSTSAATTINFTILAPSKR